MKAKSSGGKKNSLAQFQNGSRQMLEDSEGSETLGQWLLIGEKKRGGSKRKRNPMYRVWEGYKLPRKKRPGGVNKGNLRNPGYTNPGQQKNRGRKNG